jgi:hypothetical protein
LIFLESVCDDVAVVERNIREKVRTSPDYADYADKEQAVRDLKMRIANYEKVSLPSVLLASDADEAILSLVVNLSEKVFLKKKQQQIQKKNCFFLAPHRHKRGEAACRM